MLRDRVEAKSRKSHYNTMNVLSMHALIGAYEAEGYTWVNELCQVLSENVDYAVNHIRDYYRGIEVSKPQGTYMLFLDCEDWCEENYKSLDELLSRMGRRRCLAGRKTVPPEIWNPYESCITAWQSKRSIRASG